MKHTSAVLTLLALLATPALAAPDADAEGWVTTTDYPEIGDPRANRDSKKTLRIVWRSFPPTLRTDGPNSNLVETSTVHGLMFESLIQIHPNTEQFIPWLANEWKIETDKEAGTQTFSFKIDPDAKWADGSPVTANDVHKSFWHRIQDDRSDPSNVLTFGEGFNEPVIVDERTITVTTKKLNWRLFLYFGGMAIYPAKYIHIPGEEYLEDYNWKFMMGSGPYVMGKISKGDSLTLTRRTDWWGENERWGKNTYNFNSVKFVVVSEVELEYEMFKKGEFDHFRVSRAQRWVVDIPKEKVIQKGWVKQRKIYNKSPAGFSGFALNMRKWPFNDKRVRLAFAHLFNRELLMKKLFFNEYDYIDSYFPGRDWGNSAHNPKIRYDPDLAAELLDEAGFEDEDDEGFLVDKEGRRFELTLEFGAQSFERIWLVIKKDMEENGIKFNLSLVDRSTLMKKISERKFSLYYQSWGALLFPNPETSWSSKLADEDYNNNLPGFKNARVDELCQKYNTIFDRAEQKKITREIDELVFNEHPYALGWYASFMRVLYWDTFGHPENYFTKTGQVPNNELLLRWWFDADREKAMLEAKAAGKSLPRGEVNQRPWDDKADQ